MIRAAKKVNSKGCNCGVVTNVLDHELTCPKKTIFILTAPEYRDCLETAFLKYGYTPTVTIPDKEHLKNSQFKYDLMEMMKCDCGHWFPRYCYYRCPKCNKGH